MIKKVLLVGGASVFMAGVASAQVDPSIDYSLNAEVASVCGVAFADGFTVTTVDFGTLSDIDTSTEIEVDPQGSIAFICNDPDGLTRTFESANAGFLFRDGTSGGPGNQIPYTVSSSGGFGIPQTQLTSPATQSFGGSTAFANGQNTNPVFFVNGVKSPGTGPQGADQITVFAGDYSDTVTISVTAN